MDSIDTFSSYNPVINFIFYMGAIVFGMFFIHPAFLLCSVITSFAYYITVKGVRAFRLIVGMLPLFAVLSLINPIFNTRGTIILFTYLNGRPYTLEALCYGMAIAAMFTSIIVWFASYNILMTSDKFLYIFGRAMPSISLILTMVLRLVPAFQKKLMQVSSARKCIGKSGGYGKSMERAESGLTVVSAMTSWALEGGIITADSMRSRGYGSGRRGSFSVYRFDNRDRTMLVVMGILAMVVFYCGIMGGAEAMYTPELKITELNYGYSGIGIVAYFMFLIMPTALNITEEIKWRILRSRV